MFNEESADLIVDELTGANADPGRLRGFIADPRGFEGGRFGAVPSRALIEAVHQVGRFLGVGNDASADRTRPSILSELQVPLEPPPRIGRYAVESEVGAGGIGVVYRCRDAERNRTVAVKVLKRKWARAFERRFYEEAWIAKNLPSHANLVGLLDVGVDDSQGPFLVHEFVEGHDLADVALPMGLRAGCRCLREIAEALAHLHAHRVIHRDLKPSNIRLLTDDPASIPEETPILKVLDLGIAALLSENVPGGRQTSPGELLGTPRYMAPEQLQRLPVDERTDVYAFGLVAFEILVGRPPFAGATGDVMGRLRSQYRGPSHEPLAALPAWLRQLVVACLAFERTGRPDGFDEILRSLHLEQPPRVALRSREQQWRTLLAVFPPPAVGATNPYKVLHLQRSEVGPRWDFEAHLPPYVRRDVDVELDALLQRDEPRFLLLAGPSKCGKSRTAFEALARNLSERVLLLPERLEDVRGVIDALPELRESWPRPILWLDNVHEHLRAQSLSSGLLQQALDHGVVVIATIWDSELRSLAGLGAASGGTGVDVATLRAAREVVEHARIVRLEGDISAAERERAEALYPDLAFEDAGLGETFVARRLLLQRFDNGARELKALVWALVDCTRAGLLDGTPLSVLRQVMPVYLQRADPGAWITGRQVERLLDDALAQGTEPIGLHQRLVLHAGDDRFKVYDPLRYHVEQSLRRSEPLPPRLWQAVLGTSDGEARVNWVTAGLTAWQTGEPRVAEAAYRSGMREGSAAAACSLGLLLESLGDLDGAISAHQSAIDLGDPNAPFHLALLRGELRKTESLDQPPPPDALRIAVRELPGVVALDLDGAMTISAGYLLHHVIHREIDRGGQRFLLHLGAVSAIDPAGVGALVGAWTAAVQRRLTLRLCCVPPEIVRLLTTYGLLRLFESFDSEEQALASFGPG